MTDGISEESADVVGVLTERIEARFDMGMDQLKAAVAAAPTANPDATDVVKWHGLLVEAQSVLEPSSVWTRPGGSSSRRWCCSRSWRRSSTAGAGAGGPVAGGGGPRKGGTSGTGPAGGGPKTEAPRDAYVAGRFAGRSRQAQSWPCRVSMAASVVSAV